MTIFKITREDFSSINWSAIERHISNIFEHIETDISLFTRATENWEFLVYIPEDNLKCIKCEFWKKPVYRPMRPILENPRRAAYLLRSERRFIDEFLRSMVRSPWYNIKHVFVKGEAGMITVLFKVYDYSPFWKNL